jgi:hypothetical protein
MKAVSWLSVLMLALGAFAAFAQETAPADQQDKDEAALAQAVDKLLEATVTFNEEALKAATSEDAQVILSYFGTKFMKRDEFINFVKYEETSQLTFPEKTLKVAGGMGFANIKMTVPGYADGFLYGVFAEMGGEWKLVYALADPTAASISDSDRTEAEKLAEEFGQEMMKAAEEGKLDPLLTRLDKDHALAGAWFGGQYMSAEGYDQVVSVLKMGEGTPTKTKFDDTGIIVGNQVFAIWAGGTMGEGEGQPMYSVAIGTIKDGKLSIAGLFVSL